MNNRLFYIKDYCHNLPDCSTLLHSAKDRTILKENHEEGKR